MTLASGNFRAARMYALNNVATWLDMVNSTRCPARRRVTPPTTTTIDRLQYGGNEAGKKKTEILNPVDLDTF